MQENTLTETDAAALAERMALDIQAGVWGPGSWLKQIDLQERYQAKRIAVRRALDRLASQRLVEHLPNRGYHVHAVNSRRHTEIRDIRILLETGAASLIVASATPERVAQLYALAERFTDLVLHGTLLEQYEANIAFHTAMYRMCENSELADLMVELRTRTPSAPAGQWRSRVRVELSAREHVLMVQAIEAGDVARLKEVITAHIAQDPTRP